MKWHYQRRKDRKERRRKGEGWKEDRERHTMGEKENKILSILKTTGVSRNKS